jgi:hypothetical protein
MLLIRNLLPLNHNEMDQYLINIEELNSYNMLHQYFLN